MWTTIGVVVLGVVALVLVTPLELQFRCERSTKLRCRFGLRWLFGIVNRELEREPPGAVEEPARVGPGKKARPRRPRRPAHFVAMLRTRGFLRGVLRAFERLRHAIVLRDHFLWVRAGLEDPADTGLLCSWVMPAAAWLEARHPGHWDLAPVFSGPSFRMTARGRLSVTPARVVWPLLVFGLSPSTIRGFLALRTGRVR